MSHKPRKAAPITIGVILAFVLILYFGFKFAKRSLVPSLRKTAIAIKKEASQFAKNKTTSDCIKQSLERNKIDNTFKATIMTKLFLKYCLTSAKPEKTLCKDVPAYGEILKSATWAVTECNRHGQANQPCTQIMQEVVKYCSEKNPDQTKQ